MKKPHREQALLGRRFIFGLALFLAIPYSVSLAQQPITSSGLNTAVSAPIALPSGQTQFNITGGTRPGGGANLFHSFGDFNVPNNNIANFLNNSGLATSNILGRVTGGNISNIFGTIQTTGFGNANLVLMNQAGFLFGPNAVEHNYFEPKRSDIKALMESHGYKRVWTSDRDDFYVPASP